MSDTAAIQKSRRLMSLDAYRGFVMLLMVSAGFGLTKVANNPEVLAQFDQTRFGPAWHGVWYLL
ncbi:MAG TPA: hypothetical protein EYP14_00525, partial [Planctomycetaceae bacterium]|nr:hypothetical protein [Planctomycetaceae bacterium]